MSPSPVKPRKRPTQARSTETVKVILEAAARVLETRGLDGYTTNAVAEVAGVSVGSLYQYFPGKDALTAALIERETARFLDHIDDAMAIRDGREALDQLMAACVSHQLRRPGLARILDFEEQRLPLREQDESLGQRLTDLISQALARLPVAPVEPREVLAGDVLAMMRGIIDAAGERGETDPAGLQCRVARAVYGYLGLVAKDDRRPASQAGPS